jgi:hypothetical protein
MNKFEEREKAYENKFAHDAEIEFKVKARANRLLGLWAAKLLKLDDNKAVKYSTKLVEENVNSSDESVVEFVIGTFRAKGQSIDRELIIKELSALKIKAKEDLKPE